MACQRSTPRRLDALQDAAGTAGERAHSELAQALMLFIPTAFDLVATVLMNVGLLSGAPQAGPLPPGVRA